MINGWKISGWMLACVLLVACASTGDSGSSKGGDSLAKVHTQLGIEYMRQGMYEASLENFKKALKADPRLPVAHTSLAILYERLGEDDLADEHYRKSYNLKRDDPLMLNNYGQFLCRVGRLDEADKMFETALRDPIYRYPEVILANAGLCAEKRPDLERAERLYRQALEKNPAYQPALRQMVRLSFNGERYLAVRAYLQRLQEQGKLGPEFLWIGVRTEQALGDTDAVSSYAMLLKNRFPESEQAQALLEWEREQRGR